MGWVHIHSQFFLSFTVVIDDGIFIMAVFIRHVSFELQAPHHPPFLSCPWHDGNRLSLKQWRLLEHQPCDLSILANNLLSEGTVDLLHSDRALFTRQIVQ